MPKELLDEGDPLMKRRRGMSLLTAMVISVMGTLGP